MSKTIDLGAVTAYAIAVDNGFVGTETEWLASLGAHIGKNGNWWVGDKDLGVLADPAQLQELTGQASESAASAAASAQEIAAAAEQIEQNAQEIVYLNEDVAELSESMLPITGIDEEVYSELISVNGKNTYYLNHRVKKFYTYTLTCNAEYTDYAMSVYDGKDFIGNLKNGNTLTLVFTSDAERIRMYTNRTEWVEDVQFTLTRQPVLAAYALDLLNKLTNPKGKRLYANGDSIMEGDAISYKHQSFVDMLATDFEMTLTKVSVSGTTTAKRTDYTNSILERFETMTGDYDYILWDGAFNDAGKDVPIGEVVSGFTEEVDDTTFCGAFEKICRLLMTNYPYAKKLYLIPHQTRSTRAYSYYEKAIEICKKYSIQYVDMRYDSNLLPMFSTDIRVSCFDGDEYTVHPNELGYRNYYLPVIKSRILAL